MSLERLFSEITNPLDKPDFLDKILKAYVDDNKYRDFYSKIVKIDSDIKEYPDMIMIDDRNRFYSLIFNIWKNRITSMTKQEFIDLRNRGKLGNDFVVLRNYLLKVPDLYDYETIDKVLHRSYEDRTLDDAMDKYRFDSFGGGSSWDHISSHAVTTHKDNYFPIEHRLYLNTEGIDVYRIATEFTKKCIQRKIPYYFKFVEVAKRSDNLVIYSDTSNLYNYIEILREIKKEQKDNIHPYAPPIMSATIDGWIGYGSEPERKPGGQLQSFNEKRANLLEDSIKETVFQWMSKNRNAKMRKNGQEKTLEDYFLDKCAYFFVTDLKERFERSLKYRSMQETIDSYGFTLDDLRNRIVIDNIKREIRNNLANMRHTRKIELEMTVRNGKKVVFSNRHLESTMKRLIEVIMPSRGYEFKEMLKEEIQRRSPANNITLNNFAVDISAAKQINKEIVITQRNQEELRRRTMNKINNDLNNMLRTPTKEDLSTYRVK